jgi:hypothetical protein
MYRHPCSLAAMCAQQHALLLQLLQCTRTHTAHCHSALYARRVHGLLTDSLHIALLQSPNCKDQPPLHCHTACMHTHTLHLHARRHTAPTASACAQAHCTHRNKLAGGRAFCSFLQRKKRAEHALFLLFKRVTTGCPPALQLCLCDALACALLCYDSLCSLLQQYVCSV